MKKYLIPVLLILTLGLAACAPKNEETPTPAPTEPAAAEQPAPAAEGNDVLDESNPCGPYYFIDRVLGSPYPGLPEVTEDDWILGPIDAPITFMEYSEPQCPFCARFEPIITTVQALYPEDVRVVFRYFPLPTIHDKTMLGSQAMEAAGMQGKFQEFKNWLFERQSKNPDNPAVANLPDSEFWVPVAPDQFDEWLAERVSELGIDPDQFIEDMFSDQVVKKIEDSLNEGRSIGIDGTPKIFVNGFSFNESWTQGPALFSAYVELLKNKDAGSMSCPATTIDTGNTYTATIETTQGDITVELFDDVAPVAVNSFLALVESGWFEGLPILPSEEAIISGDPTGTGYGSPGYAFIDEPSENYSLENTGMVAMFAREPNRNGSAFFINKAPIPGQDTRTIFGQVTEGMDVVTALTVSDTILRITITES